MFIGPSIPCEDGPGAYNCSSSTKPAWKSWLKSKIRRVRYGAWEVVMQAYDTTAGDYVVAQFAANGTQGEIISVRTNLGIRVNAWRPAQPLPVNEDHRYFCHGYSLDTYRRFGYTIVSGSSLARVLADEFFKVGTLGLGNLQQVQVDDIIVWWQTKQWVNQTTHNLQSGITAVHSAKITQPAQQGNQLNVALTIVSSKSGTGQLRQQVPLATVNNDYKTADLREIYRFWG